MEGELDAGSITAKERGNPTGQDNSRGEDKTVLTGESSRT